MLSCFPIRVIAHNPFAMSPEKPQIVECPRDAMQGLHQLVPTAKKIEYLQALLRVGFHTLDFGSFVNPKAVPQMGDTAEVLQGLDLSQTRTRLLAIIANHKGAVMACEHPSVHVLGYPFSISETFQFRNTNRSVADSLALVKDLVAMTHDAGKELVVYLSMAFGNPYGDPWSTGLALEWAEKMASIGIHTLAMADTTGLAVQDDITAIFSGLAARMPEVNFGAHFHARPEERRMKLATAWEAGCRRFDVALQGYGGCPFAQDELVGNVATESLLAFLESIGEAPSLRADALESAQNIARTIFLSA